MEAPVWFLNFVNSSLQPRILHNPQLNFDLVANQGVPQGDPLSPFLFNIIINQLLLWMACVNPKWLVRAFADDVAVGTENENELPEIQLIIELFGSATNLEVNQRKSLIMQMTPTKSPPPSIWSNTPFEQKMKYLGIWLGFNITSRDRFSAPLSKAAALIPTLPKKDHITVKFDIIRTYVLSLFSYQLRFGPFPESALRQLEKLLWKYLCPFSSFPIKFISCDKMSLFPGYTSPKSFERSFNKFHRRRLYPPAKPNNFTKDDVTTKISGYFKMNNPTIFFENHAKMLSLKRPWSKYASNFMLAIFNGLATNSKLARFTTVKPNCPLCGHQLENSTHLFTECHKVHFLLRKISSPALRLFTFEDFALSNETLNMDVLKDFLVILQAIWIWRNCENHHNHGLHSFLNFIAKKKHKLKHCVQIVQQPKMI